ncbi:MAG: 3-hydroxyacyl-CoA dehydrogenase NAD-binding domain-containing protein [Solirubrobacterales bacterium]
MRVERVGVVGAGTMGAGIAQIAAQGGLEVVLHDPDPSALDAGIGRIRSAVERAAERGRIGAEEAEAALARLAGARSPELEGLARCGLVIEAAPERLELKRELFARLEAVCSPEAVLATNTSSLSVTAIAAEAERPQRIVGMHFFNPPPVMKLVEIVAGDASAEPALAAAAEAGEAMGRMPIRARDAIGFVANRCARPFTLESLRMLGEGMAGHEEIDRACRLGGGFRMGPFELMDLIGVDVNFAVARSFWEQSFGEPRWRPHPIQERMVASGRLGRKAGRGFYDYSGDSHREPDPAMDDELPILDWDRLEELAGPKAPEVLGRIGAQIANEACFALGEEVASADDIDTAMRLGFNWPLGPLAWGERMGWSRALGILDELRELHGDGYRAAALLRERAGA